MLVIQKLSGHLSGQLSGQVSGQLSSQLSGCLASDAARAAGGARPAAQALGGHGCGLNRMFVPPPRRLGMRSGAPLAC